MVCVCVCGCGCVCARAYVREGCKCLYVGVLLGVMTGPQQSPRTVNLVGRYMVFHGCAPSHSDNCYAQ